MYKIKDIKMPLIYNGKIPDLDVKIYGKSYRLHKEVLEKSSVLKTLISDKWILLAPYRGALLGAKENMGVEIKCDTEEEERAILYNIEYLYHNCILYDEIPEIIKILEKADYFGITDMIKNYSEYQIENISDENLAETVAMALILYDKSPELYKTCLQYIANDVEKYEDCVTSLTVKALSDLNDIKPLWFKSEFGKYEFVVKVANKLQIKQLRVTIGKPPEKVETNTHVIEKWLSNLQYYQFTPEQFEKVILDGMLSVENLQQIVRDKNRYATTNEIDLCSYHYVTLCMNKAQLDKPDMHINQDFMVGKHKFRLSVKHEKDELVGMFLWYLGDSDKCKVHYQIYYPNITLAYTKGSIIQTNGDIFIKSKGWGNTSTYEKSELVSYFKKNETLVLNCVVMINKCSPVC